jgi:hypothetical protein
VTKMRNLENIWGKKIIVEDMPDGLASSWQNL